MKYISENDEVFSLQKEDGSTMNIAKKGVAPVVLSMIEKAKSEANAASSAGAKTSGGFALEANMPEQKPTTGPFALDTTGTGFGTSAPGDPSLPFEMRAQAQMRPEELAKNAQVNEAFNVRRNSVIPDIPGATSDPLQQPIGGSGGPEFSIIPGVMEVKQNQVSTTTSSLDKEGQAARRNIDTINDEQVKAIENQAEMLVTANNTVATALQKQQQENAKNQAEVQKREADRLAKLQSAMSQYEAASKAARDEESKDFFDNNSRVTAGIAVALGALGSAFAGGPNHAMQVIQMRLQSDLETQKRKAAGIREDANNSYKRLRDILGDERLADEAWLKSAYEKTAGQVDVVSRLSKNPEILANKDVLSQGLLAKANELKITSADRIQTNVTATSQKGDDKIVGKDGVPLKENFKNGKELLEAVKDDHDLKELRAKKSAVNQYQNLLKAGASAAAKASFIAKYLDQGSYSPEFDKLLQQNGVVDRSVEGIRKFFAGGADPEQVARFDQAMTKELGGFTDSIRKKMDMYANAAKQFRFDPDAVIPGYTDYKPQTKPSNLGFTPRK